MVFGQIDSIINLSPFEKKDEYIHESTQEQKLSLINQFSNRFGYDQIQDLHQDMLIFVNIHKRINLGLLS